MAQPQFDANIFQAGLLQVAEATHQAAAAAKAAASTTSGVSSGKPSVDWSKLISKPPVFDYANQEQDQRHYRDWLWQLNQYLLCVDEGFQKELEQIIEEPAKEPNMETAPAEVRQRSAKLYRLLAGLVKNSALSIVRAAPAGNGFEAFRQLTLSMRPNTEARGLALLPSVTAWPAFQMSKPLQAQVLRLEDAFEETRRAGIVLGDESKCAIMLRCITGALKTHLSLNLTENCKYPELLEEVLRWDRAHQIWSNLLQFSDDTTGGTNNNDTVPMEIDRIEGRGRGKGSKGKSKADKGKANQSQRARTKEKARTPAMMVEASLERANQCHPGQEGWKRRQIMLCLWKVRALCAWLLAKSECSKRSECFSWRPRSTRSRPKLSATFWSTASDPAISSKSSCPISSFTNFWVEWACGNWSRAVCFWFARECSNFTKVECQVYESIAFLHWWWWGWNFKPTWRCACSCYWNAWWRRHAVNPFRQWCRCSRFSFKVCKIRSESIRWCCKAAWCTRSHHSCWRHAWCGSKTDGSKRQVDHFE